MRYTEAQLTDPSRPPGPGAWMWDKKTQRWYLVATDTADGVPDALDLPGAGDG